MKKQYLFLILTVLFISPLFVSADIVDIIGPKGTQYISDGEIEFNWTASDMVIHQIDIEDYKENYYWTAVSDGSISGGSYNLNDHYSDSFLEKYFENGKEYRFKIQAKGDYGGYTFFSDWFITKHGQSPGSGNTKVSASITSISDSSSPFIDGKAYNTGKIGVGIITEGGKDVYGDWVDVDKGGYWLLKVPRELSNGDYEVYLYLDNKEYDREDFEVTANDDSDHYGKLNLSVKPEQIEDGDEMVVYFNDIGADYYILSAGCKDGIYVGGKARPNLCVEGEKIYSSGKDRLKIDDFYPSSNRDTSFLIELSAFDNSKVVKTDRESVNIYDNVKPKVVKEENESDENLNTSQMLSLMEGLFGKNSDVYKILSLLINLGIIK